MKNFRLFLLTFWSCVLLFPIYLTAQTAMVISLAPTFNTINSGQPVGFTWSLSQSSGSFFSIPCQSGIKASHSDGSGTITCGTRYPLSNSSGDAVSLIIHNVNGSSRNVVFQVIPKDSLGNTYESGLTQTQVSVNPLQEPITDMSISPVSPTSGDATTLSWTGQVVDGVNISIDCLDSVTVSSSQYTNSLYLPCGIPIFTTDLGGSGTLPLVFNNLTSDNKTVRIKILPAISPGSYNGINAKTLTVDIKPKTTPIVGINYFSASSTYVISGSPVSVSWSTNNTVGVNIHLLCESGTLIATSSASPDITLPCNQKYISDTDFGGSGTLTFSFKNNADTTRIVTMSLVPSGKAGEYDATKSKTMTFFVNRKEIVSSSYTPYGVSQTTGTVSSQASMKKARVIFTRALRVGIRGDDVKALQEFFAQDKAIYPEGLTTGYFGPATLRAIQRFQSKHGIATSGTPETTGYGALGPKTRAFINSLK